MEVHIPYRTEINCVWVIVSDVIDKASYKVLLFGYQRLIFSPLLKGILHRYCRLKHNKASSFH